MARFFIYFLISLTLLKLMRKTSIVNNLRLRIYCISLLTCEHFESNMSINLSFCAIFIMNNIYVTLIFDMNRIYVRESERVIAREDE